MPIFEDLLHTYVDMLAGKARSVVHQMLQIKTCGLPVSFLYFLGKCFELEFKYKMQILYRYILI